MKNTFKKRDKARSGTAVILALLLCFCICLCACSKDDAVEHTANVLAATEDPNAIDSYLVIIPSDASAELVDKAQELSSVISEVTSVRARVRYEVDVVVIYDKVIPIFVGYISNYESTYVMMELLRDDHISFANDSGIFLGGRSDSASIAAIDRYITELRARPEAYDLCSDPIVFEHSGNYPIDRMMLNGYSLTEYTFVYPENGSMSERRIAHALRERLADSCGAYPDIVSDAEPRGERAICFGKCYESDIGEPSIRSEGSLITLCADSEYALASVAEALALMLEENISLTLAPSTAVEVKENTVSFSVNTTRMPSNGYDTSKLISLIMDISKSESELIFVLPMSDKDFGYLIEDVKIYSAERTSNGIAVFYDPDVLSLSLGRDAGEVGVYELSAACGASFTVLTCEGKDRDSALAQVSESLPTIVFCEYGSAEIPAAGVDPRRVSRIVLDGTLIECYLPENASAAFDDTTLSFGHPLLSFVN